MRDPFEVQPTAVNADQQAPNELMSPDMMPSGTGYVLGNGDARFWTPTSDSLIRSYSLKSLSFFFLIN